ncbi:hypothetical protein [Moraxella bovoculi]|uniref:hypothetical protein n=1 Tax=Moraxella bovoculi TaxID=386891 RepID=UPI00072F6707|nr:hypothetical protein [Moraxella bovoculi]AKG15220.2 hypothetical protein AAX08_03825 [Moraxella bovoculi]
MEKSSKLKINNNISWGGINLSGIDFNGFSSSPGWVGYFYSSELELSSIRKSSQMVGSFFNIDEFFMLSALSYDKDEDIFDLDSNDPDDYRSIQKNNLFADSYLKAIEYGFLQQYEGLYEKYLDEEMRLPIREMDLPAHILRLDFDSSIFLEFCEVAMAYYFSPVIGQRCFLINPKLGIALYPHDDIGYGCISLNNTATEKALLVDFLKFCEQSEMFKVFVESVNF